MEAAKRMGGEITEAEASAITEEASICRKHLSADNLARFLGVTYEQRQALRLTTIGSINVKKLARKELRKRKARLRKERMRRALGKRPQSESLSATQPWRKMGMSRAALGIAGTNGEMKQVRQLCPQLSSHLVRTDLSHRRESRDIRGALSRR